MNILITGGAGFIGSNLADRLLEEGHKITVIDNFNSCYDVNIKEQNVKHNAADSSYRLFRGDICDREFLEKIFKEKNFDAVIHLAARTGVRTSINEPSEYVKTNIEGTVCILEQMRKTGVKKIIFASSGSVYGNCTAGKFSEDLKTSAPVSPYAASKSAGEQMIYAYSELYNIQAVCLRFFTVYGRRQRPDLAVRKFTELIEQDKPVPVYGDGSSIRDYTYIDDILNGIAAALNYNKTLYEIINLGSGSEIRLKDMIAAIEKELGKKANIEYFPEQKGDVFRTAADITKAGLLLGYEPQTEFKEGIKKFIEWQRADITPAEN